MEVSWIHVNIDLNIVSTIGLYSMDSGPEFSYLFLLHLSGSQEKKLTRGKHTPVNCKKTSFRELEGRQLKRLHQIFQNSNSYR